MPITFAQRAPNRKEVWEGVVLPGKDDIWPPHHVNPLLEKVVYVECALNDSRGAVYIAKPPLDVIRAELEPGAEVDWILERLVGIAEPSRPVEVDLAELQRPGPPNLFKMAARPAHLVLQHIPVIHPN